MVEWLGSWMWGTLCLLSQVLGYSRKVPNWGWIDDIHTFLTKSLGIYRFLTLPLVNNFSSLEIPQNCARSLGNCKIKIQNQQKIHMTLYWSPLENLLLFYLAKEFFHALILIPLEILCPQLPLFGCFLE